MNKELIQDQLLHAGEPCSITPTLLRLDEHRITLKSNISEEDFLLRLKGMPCFPKKDLTAITGQAKSGKTVFISILLACCTKVSHDRSVLDMERIGEQRLRVMWIDTEQSPQSTQAILKNRIMRMVVPSKENGTESVIEEEPFPEDLFYIFNLRKAEISNRLELLTEGIETYRPDLVVIDNIRDLMLDINDGQKAQELIERLMALATECDCNITCVIHQTRTSDQRGMRGWLGTELMNKVFEVFACQKLHQQEGVKPTFCVEQSLTRKYDIDEPMCYQMSDEGLPVTVACPAVQPRNALGQFASYGKAKRETLNRDYIIEHPDTPQQPWEWDLRKLFSTVMGSRATMAYCDLREAVMQEARIQHRSYYDNVFAMAEKARIIHKDKDRCGRIVVQLLPA